MNNASDLIHPIQGHECLSSCIGNILNIKYPQISGDEIIIDGGGFEISYDPVNEIIGSPMYKSNFVFLNQNNISFRYDRLFSKEEAARYLEKVIEEEKYMIIKVDAKQLSHDRVFSQASNSPHYLNVSKVNKGEVYICDGYVPARNVTVFEGYVSMDSILSAWGGTEYEYLLFDHYPTINVRDVMTNIELNLWNDIKKYCAGGIKSGIYYGKDAIKKMIDDYKMCDDVKKIREANYQLRIYGFISMKEIVCNLLEKKQHQKENAQVYFWVIQEWDRICMTLVKAVFSRKAEQYESLIKKVDACIEREDSILRKCLADEMLNSVNEEKK